MPSCAGQDLLKPSSPVPPIPTRPKYKGPAEVPFFLVSRDDVDWTDPDQRELMLAELERQDR